MSGPVTVFSPTLGRVTLYELSAADWAEMAEKHHVRDVDLALVGIARASRGRIAGAQLKALLRARDWSVFSAMDRLCPMPTEYVDV